MRQVVKKASRAQRLLADYLRASTVGGIILLVATIAALICANSSLDETYLRFRHAEVGIESLHLRLTVGEWAADGLLAVFFFVAGLELKRELVVGELREFRRATVPIAAAVGGMIVPAGLAAIIAARTPGGTDAWPIPVATDIAFALAVLAITASALPPALRVFLLSLAVLDDLGSIIVIAIKFTSDFAVGPLLAAAALLAGYALLQYLRIQSPLIYVPLAMLVWALVHASGVHATIAGIALGLLTRVVRDDDEDESPAERLEHLLQPVSAGFCVPVFAFFAAGVSLNRSAFAGFGSDRIVWAVIAGLLVGKFAGVLGGTVLALKMRIGTLSPDIGIPDIAALATLSGCGFTVSLLMNDLAFGGGSNQADRVTIAVLAASLAAALLALIQLRLRVRKHLETT